MLRPLLPENNESVTKYTYYIYSTSTVNG